MKKTIAVLACVFSVMGYAQTKKDTLNAIELDQIIVNSQRFAKQKRTISQQVESISKNEIEFQNSQNTAAIFENTGMLAVQKSQQGGGSPVIRGFEASRILLVLDGIRMNNLIYRGGHLQNSITVDKNMLENIDVLFGPSSTIYGSDALGGAICLQTKNAKLVSENENKSFSGNFISNYSSVNQGKSNHVDFNFGSQKWASLTSFSYTDYGDLKMGKQKNGSNDFFGERPFYIETINGVDTKVANNDKYVQKFSGYKQYDFTQKIVFQPNSTTRHSLNLQYSTTNEIPRYDRLTDAKTNGDFKNAVWNYGPQKRLLGAYKLSKEKVFWDSDLNLTLSYQNIEESRLNRKVGEVDLENRIEKVSVLALNSDLRTKIGNGDFIYGLDIVYDDLKSSAFAKNILTGAEGILDSRYPDGKNNTFSAEGFAYFNNKINSKSSYNASFRAGYKTLKSEIVYNPLNLPYTEVIQKNMTYSGAIGFVNNPTENVKVALNLASAFRVPNIDDLAKIFESAVETLIVPNNNLKPEKTVTADLAITFRDGNRFQFESTFFYTKLYDPIVTDVFTFNGKNSIDYKGVTSIIQANQNQGQGNIFGISTSLKTYIVKSFLFYANLNATKGRIKNNKGDFPLDHIAPVYGKVGFRFENKYFNMDLNMNYSGNKSLTDYSPSGEDNLQYAPVNGMPSWEIYNFKAGISAIKSLTIFTGIENILDTQYRTFSSGINAGGRNIYIGVKYSL
jgi:hemoglobin/transferrin/lactoferrin receptor protein